MGLDKPGIMIQLTAENQFWKSGWREMIFVNCFFHLSSALYYELFLKGQVNENLISEHQSVNLDGNRDRNPVFYREASAGNRQAMVQSLSRHFQKLYSQKLWKIF